MNSLQRVGLICAAIIGGSMMFSPLSAQESPGQSASALEEIIVTAQKREENLQDVPISIYVLSGELLDKSRAQGLNEMLTRVPGVAAPIGALGSTSVVIRGVAGGGLLTGSSTGAYYLDSIPYGFVRTNVAPDANVYDLEQIEVLRGPQGTLFGANAQSGVVRILTHDPELDAFGLKTRASMSNTYEGEWNYRGDMVVNLPIIDDKLAARAVVGYQDLSGWIDKPAKENANYMDATNMRLKVKAQPTEKLSLVGSFWHARSHARAQSIGDDDGNNSTHPNEPVKTRTEAGSLKVDYDFSAFSLTSATSYIDYSIDTALDLSIFGLAATQSALFASEVFSQELVINSTHEGPWRWTAGAMYRDVEDRFTRGFDIPAPPFPTDYSDMSESWAVFGQVTRTFFDDQLELAVGLRYFEDDVTTRENISFTGNPATPLTRSSAKFDALTPRVSLTWLPSDTLTVYASYAEGFRSGLTQNPEVTLAAPTFPAVDPDRLHSYEVGTKGGLLDNRIRFDAAFYYLDWQDVQQSLTLFFNNVQLTPIVNGASASGVGLEFAVAATPTDGLDLGISFSWNDLTQDSDIIDTNGNVRFLKGERLGSSPEYTAGVSADYLFPFSNGFEGQLSASANYISANQVHCFLGAVRVECNGDPTLVARASFALIAPKHWTTTFFVENLTNERDATVRIFGVPDWAGRNYRPRTVGLQVEYQY